MNTMQNIYLDYNATTPVDPAVLEEMLPFFCEHFGNPSSTHCMGRAAEEAIETARQRLAMALGADSDEVLFTSGGTESNNLALLGVMCQHPRGAHLIISSLEHPAIVRPAARLRELGYSVSIVRSDDNGIVDLDEIADAICDKTVMVSVMHANNEIGTLQPIAEIADLCRDRDVLLHTDAAQSFGKVRVLAHELDVDLLTIAGHKVYAPKGVGALFVRRGTALQPVLCGADHEAGLRPGTENTPYIVGLGSAALIAARDLELGSDLLAQQRDQLETALTKHIPGAVVHGQKSPRLPNTLSISLPKVVGQQVLDRCPELCASTGSACHSGTVNMSSTLSAMGVTPEIAAGTIRLSLGRTTTDEDIQRAASLLIEAWEGEN